MSSEAVAAVDCHAHVMLRDAPLAPNRHSAPKRDVTVQEYLATMDAHGISHGVLTAPSFYGTDNSLLLRSLREAKGRLRGTVIVSTDATRESLETMGHEGVVGIRFNWFRRDSIDDVTTAEYRRLLDQVRALGWQVEVYIEGHKLAALLPALRGQGVTVVVDHFGSPDPALGVKCPGFQEVLRGLGARDTFVKLSGPYRLGGADPQPYVDALLEAGGPGQLVWATDWPFVGFEEKIRYSQCVEWIHAWIPDDATRTTIMRDTPARLFKFEETKP